MKQYKIKVIGALSRLDVASAVLSAKTKEEAKARFADILPHVINNDSYKIIIKEV